GCCFFQAEDGIRDFHVTGVQTCALPISASGPSGVAGARFLPPMMERSALEFHSPVRILAPAASNPAPLARVRPGSASILATVRESPASYAFSMVNIHLAKESIPVMGTPPR